MKSHPQQLPIPSGAADDKKAMELLRVWASAGEQHVTLVPGVWDDPAAWGVMLVDLAKHIARAYEHFEGKDPAEVLMRLRQGFDDEWNAAKNSSKGRRNLDN
jgi:hypothetical protein